MKFENLCRNSQDYIRRYIRGKPKTVESAMNERLVQEVIACYERGELDKKSNFGY